MIFFIFGDYIYAVNKKNLYSYEKSTSSKLLVFKIDTFGVKEISKIVLNNKEPWSSFNLMKSNLYSIQMSIYENFLYLSTQTYHDDMGVSVNEILIYDISNPQNIVQKGSFSFKVNNYPTSFAMYKNYVYVLTHYPLTLIILDISNPKSIKKIREITLSNDLVRGRALHIINKYLILQTFSKVVFFDISNPKNPLPISNISLKGEKDFDIISIRDVSKFNNYLFINIKFSNYKGHSLDVDYLFDVSSIKSPKLIKKFSRPNNLPKEISAFYKNYFFLIDDDNRPVTIRIVSLEKSTLFQEVAKFQLKEKENSSILFRDQIALNNNLFFIPYYVDYLERIAIFDISNFKKIRRLPDIVLQPGEKIFSLLTFKNNLFILTSYNDGYHKNFIVFDVSNPRLPSRKLAFELPNKFFISQASIYKNNLYALSTSFPPKLIVFDLSVLAK